MAEYTELIKALRHCSEDDDACATCQRWIAHDEWGIKCKGRLISDAAAAIEALQAELPKRGEIVRCKDCKWWEAVRGNTIGLCSHEDWTSHNLCNAVDKDGFCYRGESKDDWFCADGERSET